LKGTSWKTDLDGFID